MAASSRPGLNGDSSASPAALLAEQHGFHRATVEDAEDEYDKQHPTASAALQKENQQPASSSSVSSPKPAAPVLDVRSEELFPALGGGPKPVSPASTGMAWGSKKQPASPAPGNLNGGSHASNSPPLPGAVSTGQTPSASMPKVMSIPGKHVEQVRFAPSQMLPRGQLKKPIRDILRDTSKKYKATVDVRNGPGGSIIFEGKGTVDGVRQALKEVAQQVGSKQSVRVPIPASARPHVIGRQGTVVQGIYERTGARIQVPKPDESVVADDDDEATIDVLIEGDAVAAEMARREIEAIVKERSSNINLRLKTVPPEFFPFLAGAHNAHLEELEKRTNAQIRVPRYDTWSRPPPQEAALGQIKFLPDPDKHILISGDRAAALAARAELERRAQELQRQITLRQLAINRGQHQFILGGAADSLHSFLAETGCSIILPPRHDDTEFLTITGPEDHIEQGINRAMDLATSMQMASVDLSRQHPTAACGPHAHARALTMYLQQRQVIKELEKLYDAHIVLPTAADGPVTWEVYSRDGKNTIRARSDIVSLAQAHPPSRLITVPVDPYCHAYLRSRGAARVTRDYGVRLIVPDNNEDSHVVLVYEGPEGALNGDYQLPRRRPSTDEATTFGKALSDAQAYILSTIGDQSDVLAKDIPVPQKHQDRLRRFVTREQESKGEDYIPVRVLPAGPQVNLRGRTSDVEALAAKIQDFLVQQEKDDLERGYTISFDFPQKFANYLIGKRGENINKLRDEFDVDIKVENGKVEVKGPKAKADAAKARIVSLGKKLEDEATYILKIPAQYHRDLIGQKGNQVNRLQDRYNVRVQFPRPAVPVASDDQSVADTASEAGGARNNNRPTQAADEIVVRGPRQGADGAREEILSLYQWVVDHSNTATVSVARAQVPSLIGQRGREMDRLRTETGAQIDVPGLSDVPEGAERIDIQIKGTKKQVDDARKVLLQRVKEFDETVVKTIDVDKKHHKALIGGGGSNIRKIVAAAGGPDDGTAARMVRFPRSDSDETTIRLEGNGEIVAKVAAAIEEFVRQKEDQVVETVDVPQSQHRLLIGRGGETRRALESQFNIVLDVPKQGSGSTDVKIKGGKDAVKDAKAHILSLVKEQHGETVQVPRNLHHVIAENGAFFRRLRNDHQVTVDHTGHQIPPRPSPSDARNGATTDSSSLPLITDYPSTASNAYSWKIVDVTQSNATDADATATIPWVLSGNADNVAKAKSLVEKALANASQESSVGYLILPDPKTYRYVIGPGGSKINEIRKQTGSRINVPKNQAKGEAIEIKGQREKLEAAKEMILEAVQMGHGQGQGSGRA